MRFLIRLALLGGVALYFLPSGLLEAEKNEIANKNNVGAVEAVSAAQHAVKDFAGICERDPDVCETGRAALRMGLERARDAAQSTYQTLDRVLTKDEQRAGEEIRQHEPAALRR